MKLLRETGSDVITEKVDGKGGTDYFIEGVFLQAGIKNKNGRMYDPKTMSGAVAEYDKEYIKQNRAMGELGHPSDVELNLDRVSHVVSSLKRDGNNYIGKAKIIKDTKMGGIAKTLLDNDIKLAVSSRGIGKVTKNESEDVTMVDDYFKLIAIDIVGDPSAPDAFVSGVMEGQEWVLLDGVIKPKVIDDIKNSFNKYDRVKENRALRAFSKWLNSV